MYIPENFKSRILISTQGTATASGGYILPSAGVKSITLRATITMGNSADLALTLKYADDAVGTNAIAFDKVPLYVDGSRQTDNNTYTVTKDTGTAIIDFCIMPGQVPNGKTIGLSFGVSNAANLITAVLVEDTIYKPAN